MAALTLSACALSDSGQGGVDNCVAMMGEYPPDTILVESVESVEVPYTSWSCPGYDSDTFEDELPVLRSAADAQVTVTVEFRDDPTFEIRAETATERVTLDAEVQDELLKVRLPDATESLWIRLCTGDGRCASYETRVEITAAAVP